MVSLFVILHMCTSPLPPSLSLFLSLCLFLVISAHLFRLSGFSFNHFLFLDVYIRTTSCFSWDNIACLLSTSSSYCACVRFPQCPEVRGRHFLCVDSVESSQLLISFSALLFWGDAPGDSKNTKLYTAVHAHTCTYIKIFRQGGVFDPAL